MSTRGAYKIRAVIGMIKIIKGAWVRIILTALLFWQIWKNSHWSVTVALFLIMIALETNAFLLKKIISERKGFDVASIPDDYDLRLKEGILKEDDKNKV
jgi:hypothetical protein